MGKNKDGRFSDPAADAPDEPPFEDDAAPSEMAAPEFDLDETADATASGLARGAAAIRSAWRHAPQGPGVYRMIAANREVLYVGKARSVKKRITNYLHPERQPIRIARMIAQTESVVFVSTQTEAEALLLEANLIKQLKPRYNVLLRDDKSFPYILLTGDHDAPQILKHRGARNRKGDYFGPFASVWAVTRTVSVLQRAFLLRTCSDSYYENRVRPCLLYQIKRCSAPCTGETSIQDYNVLASEARDFLSGRSRQIRERLAREMSEASQSLEFETAARLRDRIAALSAVQGEQGVNPKGIAEADVFAIVEEAGQFCIEAFFFRTYQNWGNRAYYPRADKTLGLAEVLDAFLGQFYVERPAPRLVLLSHEIESREALAQALSARAGHRVAVGSPQRGEKKELVAHALRNAQEALSRKLADVSSQQNLVSALGAAFGIERPIRRVEVYDNSHVMGTNAVGAMVVAGVDGFVKSQYRTFNIKSANLTPGDDYAMMREVLERRFARLRQAGADEAAAIDETSLPERPDLILVDGGRGQFDAARKALADAGLDDIAIVGIAKGPDRNAGRETFFVVGREPFRLAPRDPALYFVQRLRDEAHRFAIGTHRAKRKREFTKSPLDEIQGIGPARKRALLNAFGSAKTISTAGLADLEKAAGVNRATAKIVYDFFNERQ